MVGRVCLSVEVHWYVGCRVIKNSTGEKRRFFRHVFTLLYCH